MQPWHSWHSWQPSPAATGAARGILQAKPAQDEPGNAGDERDGEDERVNLTLRRRVANLARRTWATARTAPGLLAQVEWWRGYYHWVRPHGGLRRTTGARPATPAMALGLTDHRWTVAELLRQPLPMAVPGG